MLTSVSPAHPVKHLSVEKAIDRLGPKQMRTAILNLNPTIAYNIQNNTNTNFLK